MAQDNELEREKDALPADAELVEEIEPLTEEPEKDAQEDMGGLYSKALKILQTTQTAADTIGQDIVFDEKSGISKEDQQEIIKNINEIMRANRIQITPDVQKIKAKKRGLTFPFLVNLAALCILGASFLISWLVFKQEETRLSNPSTEVLSAGQQIIEELKKKAEEELARKNKEIAEIQNNLEKINQALLNLKQNIDAEVAAKEKSLREKIDQELEAERQRLMQAGASAQEVEKKLRELQAQQASQYEAELAKIKASAEETRQQKEKELLEQQKAFNNQLSTAQEALRKVEKDYKARISQHERELTQAELKIAELSAQKEKIDLINDQILGFYRLIQQDLINKNLTKARQDLAGLRNYLNQPAVLALPEISRRQDVEYFVIESLQEIIDNAEKTTTPVTVTLSQETQAVLAIREYVLKADEAYRAGNKLDAEGYYLKALEVLPEIKRSYNYFLNQLADLDKARKNQVAALLEMAQVQFQNKQYSEALKTYGRLLNFLPTEPNTEQLLNAIQTAALETRQATLTVQQNKAAQDRLKTANDELSRGNLDEAITGYLSILSTYPTSTAAPEAITKLKQAIKQKGDKFSQGLASLNNAEIARYQKEIETLKAENEAKKKEIERLSASASSELNSQLRKKEEEINKLKENENKLNDMIKKLDAEIAGLKASLASQDLGKKLAEAEKELAQLRPLKTKLENEIKAQEKELKALKEEKGKLETLLANLTKERDDALAKAQDYLELKSAYTRYAMQEDNIVLTGSLDELLLSKSYLDTFLSSKTVQSVFPGILERIKRYDKAFEKAGRESALQEVFEVLNTAQGLKSKEERLDFLKRRLAQTSSSSITSVFLRSLISLLSN